MTSVAWSAACLATLYACGSGDKGPSGSTTTVTAAASGAGGAQAASGNGGAQAATSGTTASTSSGPATGTQTAGPATGSASSGAGPASSSASGGGCLKCATFFMTPNADPNQLCAASKPLYDATIKCVCVDKCMTDCGQACQTKMMPFPMACQQCAFGKCMSEVQACQADK
jgi:hypothetical protein